MSTPGVLHSQSALGEDSQRWATDPATWASIDKEFGFTLDAAAESWCRKAPMYLGPDHPHPARRDGLSVSWASVCSFMQVRPVVWLNPPYGRSTIADWIAKCELEASRGCTIYLFVAARIETVWYRRAFASPFLHEERRAEGRELFVDPTTQAFRVNPKTNREQRAGFPNVGLVWRPTRRVLPYPIPRYGLAFPPAP